MAVHEQVTEKTKVMKPVSETRKVRSYIYIYISSLFKMYSYILDNILYYFIF